MAVGKLVSLGRPVMCKEASKTFRASVGMSRTFPLSKEMLLDVLEVVAPVKHFAKLREFVEMKLPPGFPVKIGLYSGPYVSKFSLDTSWSWLAINAKVA